MSKWLEGRVIENRHWTESLFSLRAQLSGDAPRLDFQAGQFVRIALEETLARPFSFVNPPHDPLLEFYGIVVPGGPLSPRLAQLRAGERLLVASNPAGFLILPEVPPAQTLWLVSTGTGIAPFLSILQTEQPWPRFRDVVLVHAVRHARELVYQEVIGKISKAHALRYVTFVSRETAPGSLSGRIPAAIRDGRLEKAAGVALDAQTSHVMLCGNPDMLKDAQGALAERGLRKHRRRNPGHITVESFW
jgi:ferredoxin--NADP+ reductase